MTRTEVIDGIKTVGGLGVLIGTSALFGYGRKFLTPSDTTKIMKGCVALATMAISGMVGDKASDYFEKQVDETVAFVDAATKKAEEVKDGGEAGSREAC